MRQHEETAFLDRGESRFCHILRGHNSIVQLGAFWQALQHRRVYALGTEREDLNAGIGAEQVDRADFPFDLLPAGYVVSVALKDGASLFKEGAYAFFLVHCGIAQCERLDLRI